MEYISCPGKDRKLLVIELLAHFFEEEDDLVQLLNHIEETWVYWSFLSISFWENFGGFLIIADGFRNLLINSILQPYKVLPAYRQSQRRTYKYMTIYFLKWWTHDLRM